MPGLEVIASSLVSGFLLGGTLALTALGLSIVLGVMRLVNLAHGEFLIAGAYAALFLLQFSGIDPLIGLIPIGLLLACVAFPLQRYLLMPLSGGEPEAPMMTTFGVSIILQNLFILFFSGDTRSIDRSYATASLTIGPVTVAWIYIIGFAISVTILLAAHWLVSSTAYGR
ncbi:MAG TPA: branched-chain amino acid ABC transporter permease, partial [Methylocella sp.]|nr:branched-chain amino acid ABC transporter permease [Methylocella sp.]